MCFFFILVIFVGNDLVEFYERASSV